MKLFKRWTARTKQRATARILEGLDPHILRDIGLDHGPSSAEIARIRRDGRVRVT